ncbi:MAG: glycosyltransferase [bacterium]|nr:glycosyltransferase [bacterium]
MKPYLSVVISAWNENENLSKRALDKVLGYLHQADFSWELVIVNDGSDDDTGEIIAKAAKKEKGIKLVNNPHMGKAQGLMTGVFQSSGEVILFSDMDQATPIAEFDNLRKCLNEGYDIAIGSRSGRKGAPLYRQVLAFGMVAMRWVVLRLPFRDTQCGFKAFKRPAAEKIFVVLSKIHPPLVVEGGAVNPGFDVEILYLARKMGLKIAEVQVSWQYENSQRVRFIKDAIAGVNELLLVRWRALTGAYGVK